MQRVAKGTQHNQIGEVISTAIAHLDDVVIFENAEGQDDAASWVRTLVAGLNEELPLQVHRKGFSLLVCHSDTHHSKRNRHGEFCRHARSSVSNISSPNRLSRLSISEYFSHAFLRAQYSVR